MLFRITHPKNPQLILQKMAEQDNITEMTKTTSHINDSLLVPKVITNVSSFGRYGDNVDSTVEELVFSLIRMCWFRGVVTALKPVRAEQARWPE